jgi:S1-C subfamily serine protease
VRVSSLETQSPAQLAGLRAGDLIVGFDGIVIDSVDKLHQALDASRIARESVLKVLRGGPGGGRPIYVTVRPGEAGTPDSRPSARSPDTSSTQL